MPSSSGLTEFTPLLGPEDEQQTRNESTYQSTQSTYSHTETRHTQESSSQTNRQMNETSRSQDGVLSLLPPVPDEVVQDSYQEIRHSDSQDWGGNVTKTTSNVRAEAPVVTDTDLFDTTSLRRHSSRLSSYPVLPEPEDVDRKDSRSFWYSIIEEAIGEGSAGSGGVANAGNPSQKPDSKYMNVGTARFWMVFMTIMLSYFVACFDITLMASSHPVITSYFDASNQASWLTTAFMITNTGFQPLWGRLSDTIGRKSVYLIVLTIFALTNLWCGLATSIGSFIAARAICGIGAGGSMSMGLVITNDLVKIEHRGTYISHINVAFGVGAACGAAFGGLICDTIGWRWAFGIQVPILVACGALAIFTVPNSLGPMLATKQKDKSKENPAWTAIKNFDSLGLSTLILAVAFWILFLNIGGNQLPWNHPLIITCLVLAVLLSGFAVWIESRAKQPVLPLHLLITPPYMNLTYANFLAGVASNTVLFNAPLWFQAVELNSASASGLRLAAPAIGGSIAGVLTGNVITYTGRLKLMLVVGSVVYVGGSIALYFIDRGMSAAAKVVLITPTPLSQGFVYPASMMSAFAVSAQDDQGVVTSTLSLWRNLGIVVGVAVSSLVFQNSLNAFLDQKVQGPDAEEIIRIARSSVRKVGGLPEMYRDQVIESYAAALKLSFVTAIVASVLLLALMLPMKLPRLRKGQQMTVGAGE